MIAYLLGVMTAVAAVVAFWVVKGLCIVRVEKKDQAVQVTLWPGDWVVACSKQIRDYTV